MKDKHWQTIREALQRTIDDGRQLRLEHTAEEYDKIMADLHAALAFAASQAQAAPLEQPIGDIAIAIEQMCKSYWSQHGPDDTWQTVWRWLMQAQPWPAQTWELVGTLVMADGLRIRPAKRIIIGDELLDEHPWPGDGYEYAIMRRPAP